MGFDIEVLQTVAAQAGLTIRFVNAPRGGMFDTLSQGDRDILVSANPVTDGRKRAMDFSAPHLNAAQWIAVPANARWFPGQQGLVVGNGGTALAAPASAAPR